MLERVSTGSKVLDSFLEGGYETDAITAIYGPAGSGKTNLALLAALETARRGKKAIFIDTEGGFSVSRLKQLTNNYRKVLNKIIFLKPTTFKEQRAAVEKLESLVNNRIGLIVVDTITMLYRIERTLGENDFNKDLGQQIGLLNRICRTKRIPVIITSQVYSRFEDPSVHVVGGDIIKYGSKCLIELQIAGKKRKAILRKHRSIAGEKEVCFQITASGIA